jgi:uncharacterized protein YndB with AHSA1/START domain
MWKVLGYGAVAVVLLVGGFAGYVAMQPSNFRIERSASFAAPAEKVFAHLNDFHAWGDWSPWAKLDPNCKESFDGPTSGKGATFSWAGNSEVGVGKMTIVESVPNERIRIRLEFVEPMAGVSETTFTLKPQGDKTHLTWTMSGENNFVCKAMCVFMDMDKMLGSEFEKGLNSLKEVVEKPASKD